MAAPLQDDAAAPPDYPGRLRLDGRGFVVLGAGQGIGEQAARALAQCGAGVMCVDLDGERAAAIATAIGGFAHAADATREEEVRGIFSAAQQRFGARLQGVVDIIGMPTGAGLEGTDGAQLHRQFDFVFGHAWHAAREAVPLLRANGGGSLVYVGSIAGLMARSGSLLAYGAAKAALHHFVKGAALEFASAGIRVNAVAPGLTRTPRLAAANPPAFWASQSAQIPLGRPAEPSDIAAAALFLSSPLARHVTGTILPVDGGTLLGTAMAIAKSG